MEEPALDNDLKPVNDGSHAPSSEETDEAEDMEVLRDIYYRRRRFRILLGIALIFVLSYALK